MAFEDELGVSRRTADALRTLGYTKVEELDNVPVSALLNVIGWSAAKVIVSALRARGLNVQFDGPDSTWTEERWAQLVQELITKGIVTWKEVAVCVLGELNPPQVGTSTASNKNFQSQYEPRKTMQAVMGWFYSQDGKCSACGSRLHLEADHIKGKNEFLAEGRDPSEADTLANLQLLCKRCNVIKRESHKLGGLSFSTAQAALMWILFVRKPATYADFVSMCRHAGMTMADVRFQEAWAMAEWLKKEGLYP